MAAEYRASADLGANWPLVVGVGILAAVLVYALFIVNEQLTPVSTATSGLAGLLGSIENAIEAPLNWLANLGGNASDQ